MGMSISSSRALPEGPVLVGKRAVVTGSNTGIGFETALLLVRRGCTVVLACRSRSKGMAAAEQINTKIRLEAGGPHVGEARFMELDLNAMDSVRSFVQEYLRTQEPLHILVNNAGLNTFGEQVVTSDGLEAHFQVNYLSHFLLTKLCLPLLRKSGNVEEPARIINLSSVMHWAGKTDFENMTHKIRSDSYSSSKLAMNIFGQELQRREQELASSTSSSPTVAVLVVNPGAVQSDIYRGLENANFVVKVVSKFIIRSLWLRTERGAHGSVFAACAAITAIERHGQPAPYLSPYWVPANVPDFLRNVFDVGGPFYRGVGSCPSSAGSRDPSHGKRLWELSEQLIASPSAR